ncbi:hypothetical protein ABZY19_37020 [Streptomyces sp. NPDC006475]|uniref:hypothetical protein n=1 Tax=Streptomyces sp. NPDC006475 TaxID=3155719 RepID=UPI0033BAE686
MLTLDHFQLENCPTVRGHTKIEGIASLRVKENRKRLVSSLATAVLSASAVMITAEPAQADAICHTTWEIGFKEVGTYYPVLLHGDTVVHLWSGSPNGAAKASAILRQGDVLTLDRSKYQTTRKWSTTTQVMNELNGYDYCGITASSNRTYETQIIEGYQNAVRPCLRRNGVLHCQSMWHADQDG